MDSRSISVSRRVLQKCHFKLRNELDVPLLLPYLNQYHLISPDIHEQLTLPATHGTKVDKLLAELPRRERFLQRFIKCLRESAEREPGTSHGRIADALEEELKLQNTSDFVSSSQISVPRVYQGTSLTMPLLGAGKPDQVDKEDKLKVDKEWKVLCNGWWCCCYTVFIVIITLVAVALIVLSQEPCVGSARPLYVTSNCTVELQFDHMLWLDHIALALSSCEGQLYLIPDQDCNGLPKQLDANYTNPYDNGDFIYMLPGSAIHFSVNPGTSGQVWVFSDYDSVQAFQGMPTAFSCRNPSPGSFCFEAEEHPGPFPHTVTQAANYFIRFYPINLRGVDWYFNRSTYNFDRISNKYESTATLTRVPHTLYFPHSYENSCVLLHIPERSCNYGEMLVSDATRRVDPQIYAAIGLVICIVILIIVIGVHVYMYCRSKKHALVSFENI